MTACHRSEGKPPDPLTNIAADDRASEKRADLQGFVLIRESVLLFLRFGAHNDSVVVWLAVCVCMFFCYFARVMS